MLRITPKNLAAASDGAWKSYIERLRRHLEKRLPGFATLERSQQDQRIETWTGAARAHGFASERSLAFWCHVEGRLPSTWTDKPDIAAVLEDRGPSEPERLHRLKTRLEAFEWNG